MVKCNQLTPLPFKGLKVCTYGELIFFVKFVGSCSMSCAWLWKWCVQSRNVHGLLLTSASRRLVCSAAWPQLPTKSAHFIILHSVDENCCWVLCVCVNAVIMNYCRVVRLFSMAVKHVMSVVSDAHEWLWLLSATDCHSIVDISWQFVVTLVFVHCFSYLWLIWIVT